MFTNLTYLPIKANKYSAAPKNGGNYIQYISLHNADYIALLNTILFLIYV